METDPLDILKLLKELSTSKEKEVGTESRVFDVEFNTRIDFIISQIIGDDGFDGELYAALIEDARRIFRPEELSFLDKSFWPDNLPDILCLKGLPYELRRGQGGWDLSPPRLFLVRGASYLQDSIKVPSDRPLFQLRGMQILRTATLQHQIALQPWCAFPKHKQINEWLILNYMIPGAYNVHIVSYFTATPEALEVLREEMSTSSAAEGASASQDQSWKVALRRFWAADQEYCDERFKLVPSICEGPWAAKAAVGNKPALIGKKLKQKYYRGPNYFEVDIDISSSSVASGILRLMRGLSTSVTIDLGITIQGESPEELPERILCQTRYVGVDFMHCEEL